MKKSRLAHESFWGTIVTYVGVLLGFFTTFFVLTHYLTPEEVGLTRLLFEVGTLLSGFCLMGLSTSISRYFPYFRDDSTTLGVVHHGFWRYVCLIALGGCIMFVPLYYILRGSVFALFARNSALFVEYYYLAIPMALSIVFWTVSELYSIQLLRLVAPRFIRELVLRVLLLLVYLLYALTHISREGFLWLFVGSYTMCMLLSLLCLRRVTPLSWQRSPGFVTGELRRGFVRYTALALLSTVGTTLAGRMDLFMLAAIDREGLVSAAVFSVAFFMVTIVDIPTRAIISIATPLLSEAMKGGDYVGARAMYRRIAFYQLSSASLIFAILWANMDNILAIMPGGADYVGAKPVFFVLGLAKLIEVTFTASHPIVHSSRFYHWNIYYTLLLIAVSFFSNLFLIPKLGTVGAAVATLITCALGYGLQQGLLYYRLGIHPLSPRLLVALLLALVLWGADSLLPNFGNAWLDLCLRSAMLLLLGGGALWGLGLVPEAEQFVRSYLTKKMCHADTTR